jgi:hypothetical protein
MTCERCKEEKTWQPLTEGEARYLGVPGLTGYWFCYCESRDYRSAQERYPPDFILCTTSNAALVGLAPDTLKRLYKNDPTLGFMIDEGGNLISHPSSMTSWGEWRDEKKRDERRANVQNYSGWINRKKP